MMEFLTGVKEQETLELTTLLAGDYGRTECKAQRCRSYHS